MFLRFVINRRDEASRRDQGLFTARSEEHTSELQSPCNLVCRLLLEKKKNNRNRHREAQRLSPFTTWRCLKVRRTALFERFVGFRQVPVSAEPVSSQVFEQWRGMQLH